MEKLIIKGRYSTYKNHYGTENVPIEQKRDMQEDSCWSFYNLPGVLSDMFINNPFPLYYEGDKPLPLHNRYKKKDSVSEYEASISYSRYLEQLKGISSDFQDTFGKLPSENDVILKARGTHTNEIVKALLYAETYNQLDSTIRSENNNQKNLIEKVMSKSSGERKPLAYETNNNLIERAFQKVTLFSKHGQKIKTHFIQNTGNDLHFNINFITPLLNKKIPLLVSIIKEIKEVYTSKNGIHSPIDITTNIKNNMLNFRRAIFDLSEIVAIGGVQQVEIEGYLMKDKKVMAVNRGLFLPKVYIHNILDVKLKFTIKDWFGVDEEDIYKMDLAAYLDREGLASLWILQHQRGFRPFINVFSYEKNIIVPFYEVKWLK